MSLESAEMVMQEVISYNWMKETMQKKNKEQTWDNNKSKKSWLLKKAIKVIVLSAVSSRATVGVSLGLTNINKI